MKLIDTLAKLALCAAFVSMAACDDSGSSSTPAAATSGTTSTSSTTPPPSTTSTPSTPLVSSTLAFAAASYSTTAAASSVTITVNRSGGTSGTASVSYATVNGTAVAGTNYTATNGVFNWADGDSSAKTVAIPLVKSTGGNAFTVALANPSGATIVSPGAASVSIAAASAAAPAGSSSLSVRVQGDHFIDANSEPLQLHGVNASALEFVAAQGWDAADPWGGTAPNYSAIKTWKSNTLRLPLNEASWLGYTCVDGTGASRDPDPGHNYKATVAKAVSDATAAGLYVILDLHWTAPKNFCPLAQNPMADADNSITFWTSLAGTFKGYPNVLFELFNEPYLYWLTSGENDWTVLMQGGTDTQYVTGASTPYSVNYTWQVAGMQQMLNAVRATGATNVVLISGVSWAQDLSQWAANAPKDPLKQIAAVWHAYPDSGTVGDPNAALPKFGSIGYTWTKSVITAGYPVIITEFGDHNAPGTVGSPFASNLLPWADQNGVSYTGWTWDALQNPDNVLIKDTTGTPSDGYGVYTKAHYLCAATGSGNCP